MLAADKKINQFPSLMWYITPIYYGKGIYRLNEVNFGRVPVSAKDKQNS